MSGNEPKFVFPLPAAGGSAANASQGGELQNGEQQAVSQPLTLEQVKAVMQQTLQEYDRTRQSQQDKMEARIAKRFTEQAQALQASGVTLDDAGLKALKQAVRVAETSVQDDAPALQQQHQPVQQQQTPAQPKRENASDPFIEAAVVELNTEAGLDLDPKDAEAANLDYSSRVKFLRSYEKALADKKARLASATTQTAPQQTQAQQTPATSAPGQVSGGTPVLSIDDLTAKLMEYQKNPTLNKKEIAEISGQLRKLVTKQ